MIKLNGVYTKPFKREFKKAFKSDFESFKAFAIKYELDNEQIMDIALQLNMIDISDLELMKCESDSK